MPHKNPEERKKYNKSSYEKNREKRIEAASIYQKKKMEDPEYVKKKNEKRRHRYKEMMKEEEYRTKRNEYGMKAKLKTQYGMTYEDYWKMYHSQNGECKICNRKPVVGNTGSKRPLVVDHCHDTNKVRGLLCNQCNIMLGMAQNRPEVLASAIKFLSLG